ncbi:hypothetical protein Dimus_032290, partial [Dionaea muscipula]
ASVVARRGRGVRPMLSLFAGGSGEDDGDVAAAERDLESWRGGRGHARVSRGSPWWSDGDDDERAQVSWKRR